MSFKNFLDEHRVKKGEACNYTGMTLDRGSYFIPEKDRMLFLSKYYEHVFKNNQKSDLIERHSDLCCVLYDLDMKIDLNSEDRGYTLETIKEFITISTKIMNKYFDLNASAYQCFVLEKEKATIKKDCQKDGIHLMFPYIVTEPSIQHLIRDEVIIEAKHLFEDCLNPIEDIVDISVLDKNGWMLLGASKIDGLPYNLTNIYSYDTIEDVGKKLPEKIDNSEWCRPSLDLVNLLSIRRYTLADLTNFKDEMKDFLESWIDDFNTIQEEKNNVITRKFHGDLNKNIKTNLKTVQELVNILSIDRANNYEQWIELGFCLKTIDESLLRTWIDFSIRSEDYNSTAEADCSARWGKMRDNGGLGLGTLHMWAKNDNYAAYMEIIQNDLEYFIVKTVATAINITDEKKDKNKINLTDVIYNIVSALKQKYYHYFICANYEKKLWYEFDEKTWVLDDADIGLKRKIREDLYNDYIAVSTKYRKLSERFNSNHPNKQKYEQISTEVFKIAQKLRDAQFRKKLLEEATEQLYWSRDRSSNFSSNKFEEILDTNTKLIGFKNGIYDLDKQQFRTARCEDYVSLSTGLHYKEFHWSDQVIEDIMNVIDQILPIRDVRDYVLQTFATCLDGTNYSEHFHVYNGGGGNGKSVLLSLFENAFGEYASKLSVAALTQKRGSSSSATPEIARLKGKRLVVMQEPGEGEVLNVGLMKEFTGGDRIVARGLNKDPIEFLPQFKMILCCNQRPKVPSDDNGSWRRIRMVEFTSRFVHDPDPNDPNQFKADPELNSKMKNWGPAFLWILTEYYKKFKKNGYFEPDEVLEATRSYQADQDAYADFVNDCLILEKGSNLGITEAYSVFADYARNNPDLKTSKKLFERYMNARFGKYERTQKGNSWKNVKLSSTNDNCFINPEDEIL